MTFPLIGSASPLILASASPRRQRLMEQARLPFEAVPADIPEDLDAGEPGDLTCNLARRKAEAVQPLHPGRWILGADTVVVLRDTILGKPVHAGDALRMIEALSGREHRVVTGFVLLDPSGAMVHCEPVETAVRFRHLDRAEMEGYVETGEPFGKAGAYAIQGIGAFMVESISGSYTNVVGLPLCAVIKALISAGAMERFPLPAPASGD